MIVVFRSVIVIGFLFANFCSNVNGQMLQLKDAQECLSETLSQLDDISSRPYCVRFSGRRSGVEKSDGSMWLQEVSGCSVRGAAIAGGSYHAFGRLQLLGGTELERMLWKEILKVGNKRLVSSGTRRPDGSLYTRLLQDKVQYWRSPQIDPLGMIFALEGDFNSDRTDFTKKLESYLTMDFVETKRLEEGGVIRGVWTRAKSLRTIDFDPKQGFMPTRVRYYHWNSVTKKRGSLFAENEIQWSESHIKNGEKNYYLPSVFKGKGDDGPPVNRKFEIELAFDWLVEKERLNLEALMSNPPISLLDHFNALFEEEKPLR